MNYFKKIRKALKEGGIRMLAHRTLRFSYYKIHSYLPERYSSYNGVKVPSHSFPGSYIPGIESEDKPNYEKGLINGLKESVSQDDKIVICGGGLGVTAVYAASLNDSPSKVSVYEASKSQLEKMKRTLQVNNVSDIDLHHAIIGEEKDVWGSSEGAKKVSVNDLSTCDILELDIEGSELGVLKNLELNPRTIIVETHGNKGAPTEKIKQILQKKGYKISNIELAEKIEEAKKNDIRVITAKK